MNLQLIFDPHKYGYINELSAIQDDEVYVEVDFGDGFFNKIEYSLRDLTPAKGNL